MKVIIITLFPKMFEGVLNSSMLLKAQKIKVVQFEIIDLRQFGLGPRHDVDDSPYGGGPGMLLMLEPMVKAIRSAQKLNPKSKVILFTPKGKTIKQNIAQDWADLKQDLILLCPHYEGYDERILDWVDASYSIGNYILTGGELPAMVFIDSIVRLLPGVLGGENSVQDESFQISETTLEYPQYTRPASFEGRTVPEVLLSGNHQKINDWRISQRTTKVEDDV
jgi:tRNA (guanine37-N1)-methyltransferase